MMPHSNPGAVLCQAECLQRTFAQAPGLPFADFLPKEIVQQLLAEHEIEFRDRDYSPLVTLAVFLSQCQDADPSLRQAVLRRIAQQAAQGERQSSSNTAAYSRARRRLPEEFLADLTRHTGKRLMRDAPKPWSWHGRDVKVVDGSTASMPDTKANQQAYPQMGSQKPGVGFPIVRFVVIFALAVGTVLDAAFAPYKGKGTSELALFRGLHDSLDDGDVVLGDRHFCSFFEIIELQRRGIDVVMRQHQGRKTDFRRGKRQGRYDHQVVWKKPARPKWMDEETYRQYPDTLTMRELRVRITGAKIRTRTITIATTLLDVDEYPKADVAELYRLRWQAELNLRSLKTVMQMDVLRGQSPQMVRKEMWAHFLAYNVLRKVMAQASEAFQVEPWTISFKATKQTVTAFALPLLMCANDGLADMVEAMLLAIVRHAVGDRPDRAEPRCLKRRAKPYDLLTMPRDRARKLETRNPSG
jgi:hypothetical protein